MARQRRDNGMNCDELTLLLPELVDGTLSDEKRTEAEAALAECEDCRRQLEMARQVHLFLVQLQAENTQFRVPSGFEARLLARVRQQQGALDLFDLSSKAFAQWLLELINLVGGLLGATPAARPQTT